MLTENQLFANRYRLMKRLGQGAFSEVWKAEDTKVGNLIVALKVYAPDKGLDEDGAKVFGDEFAIVFNIHHQNLLTPSTFDEEKGSPYLVLPYCERGSALRLIGKMDEKEVARFLHDVSSALVFLHQKEIVHQDIKPDNVLIDSEGTFLVTDFGISTRIRSTLRRSVGDKKSAGTMAYMGPERFSKNPDPIKSSDIWSLGAAVFELMKGDVPFGDMGGGMQKLGAEVPNIPGGYSPELKQLIERCLAPETWDRPTAAQLRDISEKYLRTGKWDLSPIGGGAKPDKEPQEPLRDDRASKRPTQRKVTAKPVVDTPPQPAKLPKDAPTKEDPPKTASKPRKRLPWIIGGVAAVAILAVLLGLAIGKGKKNKAVDETNLVAEEPSAIISSPEVKALAQTYTVNGVSFTMIYVEGGTFQMGATSEQGNNVDYDEKPVHEVTLSDFCIGETEVTQALWQAVMGSNPSYFKGDNRPVESMSWNDCQMFIQKLNQLTGRTFRLPTEAEWEYAARGGKYHSGYKYSGSNEVGYVAWYGGNSGSQTHDVKTKQPNALGLYDMSGNVWEWCSDWYGSYSSGAQTDPQGPSSGSDRVLRGGSRYSGARYCRVSGRNYADPGYRGDDGGFRLSLVR